MKKLIALALSLLLALVPGLSLAEEIAAEAEVSPLSLGESLMFMLKGLVGIFLVTGLIILVLVILEKATKGKQE